MKLKRQRQILFALAAFMLAACAQKEPTGTVKARVVSITVSPDTASLQLEETIQLEVTVVGHAGLVIRDRNDEIVWNSSDSEVARVDRTGFVSAVSGGVAGISARINEVNGLARIRVLGRVNEIFLVPNSLDLLRGDTASIEATLRDKGGNLLTDRPITWESSAESVATVDSTGLVTAVDSGSAVITVRSEIRSATVPILVSLPLVFMALEAGNAHTCGIDVDSLAFCWGAGGSGQLGQPGGSRNTPGQVESDALLKLVAVTGGGSHSCAVTVDGAAWCWGSNSNGQATGVGDAPEDLVLVPGGLSFASLSAGGIHTCGVTTSNEAYCWGANDRGQLGDQTNQDRGAPVPVSGGLGFAQLSAGGSHTCGVTNSNSAFCWGANDQGQLGDGTNTDHAAPVAVSGALAFTTVSAGASHSCGVTTSGLVYCWGANAAGQLGDGTKDNRSSPAAVSGGHVFGEVAAGGAHTCGVVPGDALYCWGANANGQLGDRTTLPSTEPTRVDGGPFVAVSAGTSHTCGRTSEPLAYCWGWGVFGQLGSGPLGVPNISAPILVAGQR